MRSLLVSAVLVLAGLIGLIGMPAASASGPTAHQRSAVPSVGPLFFPSVGGLGSTLRLPHLCSASVVASGSRDLVITAAHCVYGTGLTIEFAPGFHDGIAPYGVWSARRVYVAPRWRAHQDPARDVAILEMAPRHGRRIQDVVGGHRLGRPAIGAPATVLGYLAGSGGRPITCTNVLGSTNGYPRFDCAGYGDGVSGGPWLQHGRVVGVTGGLEQGGCTAATTYTSRFGAWTTTLLRRAGSGARGDFAPIGFLKNAC